MIKNLNSSLSCVSGSADWVVRGTDIERKSLVACEHWRAQLVLYFEMPLDLIVEWHENQSNNVGEK